LVDVASLPSDAEIALEWDAFLTSLSRPPASTESRADGTRFHRPVMSKIGSDTMSVS